jgi:integrase
MHSRHILKRGKRYSYVCRIPADLQDRFPSPTIWKSLHTDDVKQARLLAGAEEYRTQQLFMHLRCGMLSKDLEKRLVALYLKQGVDALELQATGQSKGIDKAIDDAFTALSNTMGISVKEARERRADYNTRIADGMKDMIASQEAYLADDGVSGLADRLKENHGIKMTSADKQALSLKLLNTDKQLHEAESALLRGEWSLLEALKERVERDLATPYFDFKTVLEKYQEWYLASKPNLKQGTKDDMAVECRVLLEIIGNTSIAEVNTMDTVAKLKSILQKYPKNKQQRFGDKSIHSILRSERDYEKISLKTANEYIKRLKAVIDYAAKSKMLNAANVVFGELFRVEVAEEDQRLAYDNGDVERMTDSICTQPLWTYNPPKPERFWIVLITLFHGLRLGNIVSLTKADICQTDRGTWVFDLRRGKTKSTVRPVAICDTLLLLGFLDWVERLDRNKLFQDSVSSFSTWYNRNEKRADGYAVQGFEAKYITTDPKKCLYSLRHNFAGNVFEVTEDFKITSDMMGHSTGKSVTARYTKRTKAETLKEVTEKMQIEHIDLDRLEARALELFS